VLPLVTPHACAHVIDDVHDPRHKGDRALPWLVQNSCKPRHMTAAPGDGCYLVLSDALRLRAAPASGGNDDLEINFNRFFV
jgi:hypothetical protein